MVTWKSRFSLVSLCVKYNYIFTLTSIQKFLINVFFKLCNLYVFDIVAGSFLITCANLVCYLKHFEHETQHIFLNWSAGGWRCPRSGVRASLLCYLANILCSVFWETLWWQPSTMRTRSRPKWMVFRYNKNGYLSIIYIFFLVWKNNSFERKGLLFCYSLPQYFMFNLLFAVCVLLFNPTVIF